MNYMDIPIVKECCAASENIKDYFIEERYLTEVEQNESITPNFLSVIAINLLLEELSDMGIESEFSAEDLMQEVEDRNAMFYFRNKFDKDNYYRFLRSLTPERYSEFCGVVENCTIAEDLLIELADFATAVVPTDIVWDLINQATDRWYSTEAFGRHISALQTKVDLHTDPNTTPVNDRNIIAVAQFLQKFKQRQDLVTLCITWVIRHKPCNGVTLQLMANHYDREKLKPDLLPLFAEYSANPSEEEPAFMKKHHDSNDHHLEYWLKRKEQYIANKQTGPFGPTIEQGIFCVISLILDGFRGEKLAKEISRFKTLTSELVYKYMIELSIPDWDKILRGELK